MELTYMLILWNAILDTTWRRRRENWPQKVLAERKNDWSSWHLALLDIQSWKNLDLNFVTLLSKWFVTVCQKCFDLFRMTFFGRFLGEITFLMACKCNFTFSNFEYSSSITKIVNESISEEKLRHLMPSFLKTGKNGSIHVSQSHAYSRHFFFFNCIQAYFFFDGKMNFFRFWQIFFYFKDGQFAWYKHLFMSFIKKLQLNTDQDWLCRPNIRNQWNILNWLMLDVL